MDAYIKNIDLGKYASRVKYLLYKYPNVVCANHVSDVTFVFRIVCVNIGGSSVKFSKAKFRHSILSSVSCSHHFVILRVDSSPHGVPLESPNTLLSSE
jgi:hypothetical protein